VGAAGRKAKLARSKAAAAAAAGGADAAADEEAQQEVTVLMMQQLPALLTMYQAEPVVVSKSFHSLSLLLCVVLFAGWGQVGGWLWVCLVVLGLGLWCQCRTPC
jgi:hypothetical protein